MFKQTIQPHNINGMYRLLFIALLAVGVASCNDINTSNDSPGQGHLNMHLTDAPGQYSEVNVEITGLKIHYYPAGTDTTEHNKSEWVELPVDPVKVNLLDYQNGVDTLLSSSDVDAGQYKEIRLLLGNDNDVVVDGQTYDLKVPSGQSSGYKIKFSDNVDSGQILDVMLDFNAGKSVHQAGKSGKFILRPVIHASVASGDTTSSALNMNANPSMDF